MIMKPISILLSFVYTPLILSYLGDSKYGIWAIILNIISWINYFDIGIGNGLRNKLTEAISLNNFRAAKRYVSTAYAGTLAISVAFGILINILWNTLHLSSFFNLELQDENVDFIIFLSVFFVCLNFVLSLSKTSAYAIQQPAVISVAEVICQVVQIAVIYLIAMKTKGRLLNVALIYGIIILLSSLLVFLVISRKREYLRPDIRLISKDSFKPLFVLGSGFFVLQICSLILNTTDNLLISNLYGSEEVTPYSLVYNTFYILVQIHAIIIMPLWSAYTEAYVKKDIIWIRNTIKKINIITLVFSIAAVAGIFIFEPFAIIWLRKDYQYEKLLIIIVAIYMIAQMFANNYSSFLCGVGHIGASVAIASLGAIINIPLSVILSKICGLRLSGVILGSLIVMLINVIVLPIVSKHWIDKMKRGET